MSHTILTAARYASDLDAEGAAGVRMRIFSHRGVAAIVAMVFGMSAVSAHAQALQMITLAAVSYTHLDVYKRQV